MKKIIYLFQVLLFTACSQTISPYMKSNIQIDDVNIQIINKELHLSLITPADIEFIKRKSKIIKEVNKLQLQLENILLFGSTDSEPFYTLIVTHGEQRLDQRNQNILKLDTLINDLNFSVIAIPLDSNFVSYKIDARDILKSMKEDTLYLMED